ncbi:LPXTG cell wall anchor domain-containing protein, partial [Streptococcus intermedius]
LAVTDITFEVDVQGKVTVKDANGNSVKADGNKLTVTDQAVPSVPTPGKSKTPSTPKQDLPQTGDGVKLSLYAWLMLISGSLLAIVGYARRKNER